MTERPLVKRFSQIEAQTILINYQKYSFENLGRLFVEGITPTYEEIAGETAGVTVLHPRCGWFTKFLATVLFGCYFSRWKGKIFISPFERDQAGKVITRSTVANVIRHARRYAGIWDWGGYEIRGLIPPRISEEQAERILDNLKRNREKSYGFGKRKWMTSRVICGLCGHKYKLRKKNGCTCLHSDPLVAQPPCSNVNIPWRRLSFVIWDTFIQCMTSFQALELCIKDKHQAWKTQKAKIRRQVKALEEQISRLEQKRRHYSWQQAEGIINKEELRTA